MVVIDLGSLDSLFKANIVTSKLKNSNSNRDNGAIAYINIKDIYLIDSNRSILDLIIRYN